MRRAGSKDADRAAGASVSVVVEPASEEEVDEMTGIVAEAAPPAVDTGAEEAVSVNPKSTSEWEHTAIVAWGQARGQMETNI